MTETKLLQGNQAAARAAIEVGCRFYAGYPITPSSEIAEEMARALPKVGGVFAQMEDEISSLGAVIGASVAGVKGMTATSGPGFSLMQEHIGYAAMAETPCVIVNVMRAGPSTGMPTSPAQGDVMQLRWGTHGDHPIIALVPSTVSEVFDLVVRAFNLAERFRTPVIVAYDEVVGHTREGLKLPDKVEIVDRRQPEVSPEEFLPKAAGPDDVPPMPAFGDGYRFHVTGLTHDDRGFPTNDPEKAEQLLGRIHRKIDAHLDEIIDFEEFMLEDAEVAIFAYGIVGRAAKEAALLAREQGIKAGVFRPITLWPFPSEQISALAERVPDLVVAEMNMGQMLGEVERAAGRQTRISPHLRADGRPIAPNELLATLAEIQNIPLEVAL